MEDAGVWVRVSSGAQDEANQVPDVEGYCAGRDYRIVRRYTIHAKSAYHGRQQKHLDEMLSDIRAGIIKVIVVWHSDRLERREGKKLLDLVAEINLAGGRVESVQESWLGELETLGGSIMTTVAGHMNHEKSKHLSEQVKISHNAIRANGAFSGRIPFGYKTEGAKLHKQLVPTQQGRDLIPTCCAMIIDGKSLDCVAAWLAEQTGKSWSAKITGQMIRRATYKGCHEMWTECTCKGNHRLDVGCPAVLYIHKCEALVDAATWQRAVDSLAARPKRGKIFAENRAMLAGALTCPQCGAPMYRLLSDSRRKSGTVKVGYYRCAGTGVIRKSECKNMVRCEVLDAKVDDVIVRVYGPMPEMTRKLIPGSDHSAELAEVAYELQRLPMRGLSRDEQRSEQERLWALEDELRAMPATPDSWQDCPTGETLGQVWTALSVPERGAWLHDRGFTVTATRESVRVVLTFSNGQEVKATEGL